MRKLKDIVQLLWKKFLSRPRLFSLEKRLTTIESKWNMAYDIWVPQADWRDISCSPSSTMTETWEIKWRQEIQIITEIKRITDNLWNKKPGDSLPKIVKGAGSIYEVQGKKSWGKKNPLRSYKHVKIPCIEYWRQKNRRKVVLQTLLKKE